MHEMVLVDKALDMVLEVCRERGIDRVEAVHLRVGEARDVVEEFVQDMFSYMARGTAAEYATLVMERVPLRVRCRRCGATFPIAIRQEATWTCPECGTYHDYQLVSGNEFELSRIDACMPEPVAR